MLGRGGWCKAQSFEQVNNATLRPQLSTIAPSHNSRHSRDTHGTHPTHTSRLTLGFLTTTSGGGLHSAAHGPLGCPQPAGAPPARGAGRGPAGDVAGDPRHDPGPLPRLRRGAAAAAGGRPCGGGWRGARLGPGGGGEPPGMDADPGGVRAAADVARTFGGVLPLMCHRCPRVRTIRLSHTSRACEGWLAQRCRNSGDGRQAD